MLVPINLTGGTYVDQSRPLSAQVCKNFWPRVPQNARAKSPYVLQSFPGLELFGTATGADRGMFEHLTVLYKVTGTTLYTVASDGTHTSRGTIPGSGRCIFDGIGSNVVIVTDGIPYVWNGSTITTVSDVDLETPNGVTHINNQVIYDGDGGRFASSAVGDATDIDGLDYATAETNADDLVRAYAYNEIVYMLGDKTTETWWNSGTGRPPFDRLQGGGIPVGLGALHSVAQNDRFIYFLGDDNSVYRVEGSTEQNVTPDTLVKEFSEYDIVSDAIGQTLKFDGQEFYFLTFPTGRKTWIYPEGGEWFQLSSGVSGGRYIGNSYAFAHRKHLISDYRNGNIYELKRDVYAENGAVIQRVRDSAPLHGGLINQPGKMFELNRFELILETGVGIISGQGSDPQVMLSISEDGGRTFGAEMWGAVGKSGQFQQRVEWHALGSMESAVFRITVSDPVFWSIHSAAAEIEMGI